MQQSDWNTMRQNPKFLSKEFQICIDCYLQLVKNEKQNSGMHELEYLRPEDLKEDAPHTSEVSKRNFFKPSV